MTSNIIILRLTFLAIAVGGREGARRFLGVGDDDDDDGGGPEETATTVADVIAALERNSESSLSKGVMVVATGWSTDGAPDRLLRVLRAGGHEHSVYAADAGRLLADGRAQTARPGRDGTVPDACVRPGDDTALLPPRSRYVVLFRDDGVASPSRPARDALAELAALNRTFWAADVYYVIVVREFDPAARQTVYGAWRDLSIYKVIVVTSTAIRLLDPFVHNAVDGRFTSVPLRSPKRIPDILQSRIRNLRRFPLRIVINKRMPTVIAAESGAYMGQDGTFAAVLAAKMNATPVYISEPSPNGKFLYGYKRTGNRTYGTFAGVIDGYADVSVNGHFLKDYNCYSAEFTRHITSDKVCLLSPKAGVIPPMLTVLMSFQREVWTMTAITCIIVTFIYYAATAIDTRRRRRQRGPTGCNLGLEIYRMFIGAPTDRIFAYSCHRTLTAFSLIFTLVILNAFQGSLVTFLSTPMHYPDINTFKDLKQSELPIRTSSINFKEIFTGDSNLKPLAHRVEMWAKEIDIYNSDGHFAGFERVNVFNLGHFKDVLFIANKNNTRVLHTMSECLISYFISESPHKRRINLLLSWVDQAGLVLKWNSDVSKYIFDKYVPINPKDYETSKVFSVRDLEIAFIVLSFGIILSTTVFIIELLMYKRFGIRGSHPSLLPFLH